MVNILILLIFIKIFLFFPFLLKGCYSELGCTGDTFPCKEGGVYCKGDCCFYDLCNGGGIINVGTEHTVHKSENEIFNKNGQYTGPKI